jgi:hypothetical protein
VQHRRAAAAGVALLVAGWAGAAIGSAAGASTTASTTTSTTAGGPLTKADYELLKGISSESKVGSVRIVGTIKQGSTTLTFNLLVNGDGEGGGTFVQDGSTIQLKRVGTLLYFDAPTTFWSHHGTKAQAKKYGGKWIEVSALTSQFQSFDQFLNASDLVTAVFSGHTTPLSVSKPVTYEHHKVVIVTDTVVHNGKATTGELYLADQRAALAYKILTKGPKLNDTIVFSHYGKAVSISTPPEPINLS